MTIPKSDVPGIEKPDAQNPYRPPRSIDSNDSWWNRLKHWFRILLVSTFEDGVFADGDAIIFEGIAFFINPDDPEIFYAATPCVDRSPERLQFVVDESLRVFPEFLAEYQKLRSVLYERKMIVRIIDAYSDKQDCFVCEIAVEPSRVTAAVYG